MQSEEQGQIFKQEDEITFSDLEIEDGTIIERFFKPLGIKFVGRQEEEDRDDCEFDLRMMDVPDEVLTDDDQPDLLEVRIASVGKQVWSRTPHKRLLASAALLTLVVLFVGISSFSRATLNLFPLFSKPQGHETFHLSQSVPFDFPASHTEENYLSFGPNTSVMVTARAVPTYCARGAAFGQGRQIGNFPVWPIGVGNESTVHLRPVMLQTIKDWKGWTIPFHIVGRYDYIDSISLSIFNVNGSSSPLLQDKYTQNATAHIFLARSHVASVLGTNTRELGRWDVTLYIPNAGCYGLSASWGRGHWLINFAAGQ